MFSIATALVQMNGTVGAIGPNAARIVQRARQAVEAGAALVVVPELALSGYPPEDLVLQPHFITDCAVQLDRLARELPPQAVVVVGSPVADGNAVHNSAVVFFQGAIAGIYHKMALPNYGVFDEKRVFTPGDRPAVLEIGDARIALHICEDSWALTEPACTALQGLGLDAVINLSASPYHRGKLNVREDVLGKTALVLGAPLLYCNLVGGQDELVFDGASLVLDANGNPLARAKQFEEDILYFNIPVTGHGARQSRAAAAFFPIPGEIADTVSNGWKPSVSPALDDWAEVYTALTLGLRDYVEKNGFRKVIVALSGGIDSALVATLAVDALGKDRVAGLTMPSQFSSNETRTDAELVAKNLGIEFLAVPIRRLFETYLEELAPLWKGRAPDITEENLQARIRGNIVMALSNKFGWLVLTTGNKSELATGYCTLYGDMVGGFAVIKDVPKTLVFDLAKWRNASRGEVIPPSTIARPPTAELKPNQTDQDTLPPYDRLDAILERYVERDLGFDEIVSEGFDPATVRRVLKMADASEYKRRQGAPGIKITPKAFGRDRRMPITNRYGDWSTEKRNPS